MMPSSNNKSQIEIAKKAAASRAIEDVKDGMIIGLGTGSTAYFLIEGLIQKVKEGLKLQAASSSIRSEEQARAGGIEILDLNICPPIDLTIDGADELTSKLELTKGGGGALLREKLLATHSSRMHVIADQSKKVSYLGAFSLPIEIVPFGYKKTCALIDKTGSCSGRIRESKGDLYITDNKNYIYDLKFEKLIENPLELHQALIILPGVVETGLFLGIAKKAYLGFYDGHVEIIEP